MKYTVSFTNQFKKDLKRAEKRGRNIESLFNVVERISNEETLEPAYHLHRLVGQYEGCFECHIEPDWLLIYKKYESTMILMLSRLGSHSDLFK